MTTGASEDTKLNNIYDLAGNIYEWTTETGYHDVTEKTAQFAVLRGGSFFYLGEHTPVSYRYGGASVYGINSDIGFRVVLYVN